MFRSAPHEHWERVEASILNAESALGVINHVQRCADILRALVHAKRATTWARANLSSLDTARARRKNRAAIEQATATIEHLENRVSDGIRRFTKTCVTEYPRTTAASNTTRPSSQLNGARKR